MKYSKEKKEALLRKLLDPAGTSVTELSIKEGIPETTLYTWRARAKRQGLLVPSDSDEPKGWTSKDKLCAVIETASMTEIEIAEYCRKKGIYLQQLTRWKEACENANDWQNVSDRQLKNTLNAEKSRSKKLEKELARKEKALAEAAALLVLRRKAQAIWGDGEDE